VPQRDARHVLHHQVAGIGLFHRVEQLHHVRVVELAHQGGLGGEEAVGKARLHLGGMGAGLHPLDRHRPVVEAVVRQEDLAGGPGAQTRRHPVLADVRRQIRLQRQVTVDSWRPERVGLERVVETVEDMGARPGGASCRSA
jgi:hypothetical protein